MPQAAIFDVDGTLVDSVDLHAMPRGSSRHTGGPWPDLSVAGQCQPDVWGRMAFFGSPSALLGLTMPTTA